MLKLDVQSAAQPMPRFDRSSALPAFPTTRYQGSKRKILNELHDALSRIQASRCLDLYSGSGTVTLLLRMLGRTVDANDYLLFNQVAAELMLTLTPASFAEVDYVKDLEFLFSANATAPTAVAESFSEVFFTDRENREIDWFCENLKKFSGLRRSLYVYAMGQAMLMKRPYNLFHRANLDMRLRDVERSFGNKRTWDTPFKDHCAKIIRELARFPFPQSASGGRALNTNTAELSKFETAYDLVYVDPPYLNGRGVAVDYCDFYHFLDGLVDYSLFTAGNAKYPHRPIRAQESAWTSSEGALRELERIVARWKNAVIFLSYRSDGLPTAGDIRRVLVRDDRRLETVSCGDYKYALSKAETNQELFFISFPRSATEMPSRA
jgi:adenine-specific DNA-methyltransferase